MEITPGTTTALPRRGTAPDPQRHPERCVRAERLDHPVVVGAGLAGYATALALAARGCPATVLSPETDPRGGDTTSTARAQGGLAAALGADDSPALHAEDTLAAGGGLTEPAVARRVTAAGPAVVDLLLGLGTRFDRDEAGALRLGLEGAHGRHRIVHADGDSTGAEILRAVAAAADEHPLVTVRTGTRVARLVVEDGVVRGLHAVDSTGSGRLLRLEAPAVVLATGGLGALFAHTTNPVTSWGSGLALGLRAGATVRDLEMVQFHPTALAVGGDPMPLVSEAVRGEGVALVLDDGTPLANPLAARDVVARAVWEAMSAGRGVFLDVPGGPPDLRRDFARRFPTVTRSCRQAGLDPSRDRLPVRPAAHYHMGGLAVDERGRTDVPGLWAVGEVASTGLHGANRLASNSLLEAVACAQDLADDLAAVLTDTPGGPAPVPGPAPVAPPGGGRHAGRPRITDVAPPPLPRAPGASDRALLESAAGLYRDGETLRRAAATLGAGARDDDARLLAALLLTAALDRAESRGAHRRLDHPEAGRARHTLTHLGHLDQSLRSAS